MHRVRRCQPARRGEADRIQTRGPETAAADRAAARASPAHRQNSAEPRRDRVHGPPPRCATGALAVRPAVLRDFVAVLGGAPSSSTQARCRSGTTGPPRDRPRQEGGHAPPRSCSTRARRPRRRRGDIVHRHDERGVTSGPGTQPGSHRDRCRETPKSVVGQEAPSHTGAATQAAVLDACPRLRRPSGVLRGWVVHECLCKKPQRG